MKFQELVAIVADEPVFETGLLLAGPGDTAHVQRQLSRWARAGRIRQLRRGLYTLNPPWRKRIPHPFLVANRLVPGSYVSSVSVLAHAQAIPEYVAEVTSITGRRPHVRSSSSGRFSFRHLKADRPGLAARRHGRGPLSRASGGPGAGHEGQRKELARRACALRRLRQVP